MRRGQRIPIGLIPEFITIIKCLCCGTSFHAAGPCGACPWCSKPLFKSNGARRNRIGKGT